MIRYLHWHGWRIFLRISSQAQASSSAPATAGLHPTPCSETEKVLEEHPVDTTREVSATSDQQRTHTGLVTSPDESKTINVLQAKKSSTGMVAAAFASLKNIEEPQKRPFALDQRITSADSVGALLAVAELPQISRRHALRIVSQLADWTTSGRVKLSDFEADNRFLKLCRLLGRGLPRGLQDTEKEGVGFGDLAVVLGVTGDDEAAKLVAGISLSQMIKITSSLAQKQRRSTPLLRSLAFNIARQTEKLNVKNCADLLYAVAVLNFPDELLLEKICADLYECIATNEKPAVVGSILTSLGLLKYKNTEVLDMLADWVKDHVDICRPQDLTSLLLTLASVSHVPANADHLFNVLLPQVSMQDAPNHTAWLDIVWSLIVLDRATPQHVASVLDPDFCNKFAVDTDEKQNVNIPSKLKLLNINAAAHLQITGYKGPLLPPDSEIRNAPLTRSKDKQFLVASILDSFSNLLPSSTYLRSNINTGMGFLLDGECMLDSKCNPLPVGDDASKSANTEGEKRMPVDRKSASASRITGSRSKISANQKGTRIAIVALDYRDMCRGSLEPNGVAVLSIKLLERAGYKVLSIPHTEYNPRDKLVRRVQYLDHNLKALVRSL